AGRAPVAEVALEGLARGRVVEHRPVRTGDRAELAADAAIILDVLRADGADRDGAHRAGRHAPAFRALRARVRRVGGVALEGRDADDRLGRLVRPGLHVRARQLAAQTARALLRMNPEYLHRLFLSVRRRAVPRSSRPMNSSTG